MQAVKFGAEFDQTGFGLPSAPEVATAATGPGQLFSDDCSQPGASDQESVFWPDTHSEDLGFRDPRKPDDFIHPDAMKTA